MEKNYSEKSTFPKGEPQNMTFEQVKKAFNKMENDKYKRPKKGEESKLTEYKKVTNKPVNKQQERQIVKNDILLLAKDLFNEKKINKPLYNKLYNITIGAARMPTLQATLSSLQDFKKEESKAYKKSDFKAKVKEAKTEDLGTFNVYVKYRVERSLTEEEIEERKYLEELEAEGHDVKKELKELGIVDINITDKVIGKSNIPNTIKKNLQYL